MELIRPIVKVGNSAGLVLPREWLNGRAKVILIEKAPEPEKEIFDIVKDYLTEIKALAIVGSYARGEKTRESDVDVLVVTESTNKRIKQGKYEIIMISEEKLEEQLEQNVLPFLPMIKEAKPIINEKLFEKYKNTKLTNRNLAFHFETTKSAMNVVKKYLELIEEDKRATVSDSIVYSLILRLREWYIVECLIKNKRQSKKELITLVKDIGGSYEPYYAYARSKNEEKDRNITSIDEALKIHHYLFKKIREQQEWKRKKG